MLPLCRIVQSGPHLKDENRISRRSHVAAYHHRIRQRRIPVRLRARLGSSRCSMAPFRAIRPARVGVLERAAVPLGDHRVRVVRPWCSDPAGALVSAGGALLASAGSDVAYARRVGCACGRLKDW